MFVNGVVIEGVEFDRYSASGSTLSMDEAVLEIIGSLATGNVVAVLTASLDCLMTIKELCYLTHTAVRVLVVISTYMIAVNLQMVM